MRRIVPRKDRSRAVIGRLGAGLLTAAAAALLATGSASTPAAAETVLRIKPFSDLRVLDPVTTSDYAVRNHGYLVYDTLFALDEQLSVRPQMVDAWETSEDGKTWTFKLRDGLAFHDGSPVTSTDVVASLQRWAGRDGHGALLLARMETMEVVDDATFRIVLKQPWNLLVDALAKPSSLVPFIMPARIAALPNTEPLTDPVGSGPFIMKTDEWVPGSKIVYVRNPDYVPRDEPASGLAGGKVAGFDRIEWVILPDPQTAASALQRGEIDIFEDVPPDLVPLLAGRDDVRVVPQDNIGQHLVIRMNWTQPPFDDPLLRRAVLHAVDQSEFIASFTDDPALGLVCPSVFTCASPYFTDAGFPEPNLERARELVKEAGYDGTPVVILQATDLPNQSAYSRVADQLLRQIGFETRLESMDWPTVATRRTSREPVSNGGWSLFVAGPAGLDTMDPLSHFPLRANCDAAWPGWACDEELETLRSAFADAPDVEARRAIAEQAQLRAMEVVPYVPLGQLSLVRGVRSDLTGIVSSAVPVYWNIRREP